MPFRKKTIRKLAGPESRKAARLINDLESTLTKLKNLMPVIETMEIDSIALYKRLSTHEKQIFAQEKAAAEIAATTEGAEIPHTDGADPENNGPLFAQSTIKPICQSCTKSCKDGVNAEFPDSCTQYEKQVGLP